MTESMSTHSSRTIGPPAKNHEMALGLKASEAVSAAANRKKP